VIGAAALHNVNWFYPAFLMIVGAHHLPFIFLYGMWQYGVPAAVMLGAGLGLGRLAPASFPPGGGLGGSSCCSSPDGSPWPAGGTRTPDSPRRARRPGCPLVAATRIGVRRSGRKLWPERCLPGAGGVFAPGQPAGGAEHFPWLVSPCGR
jgi:hypothetical protein